MAPSVGLHRKGPTKITLDTSLILRMKNFKGSEEMPQIRMVAKKKQECDTRGLKRRKRNKSRGFSCGRVKDKRI